MAPTLLVSSLGVPSLCVLVIALLLVVALKVFPKKVREKDDLIIHQSDGEEKTSRRLGMLEQVFLEREKINNWGTVSSVLLLDSTQELRQDELRKALVLLAKRYPLLRMRIQETTDGVHFEEMENPTTIDFELLNQVTADDWVQGFEAELNSYEFNITRGPLWRARLLKETFSEGKFTNAVVFTFQHVICDALSIFEFQKTLLEFLASLHGGVEFKVESLPLKPPLESLMPKLVQPSIAERAVLSSFFSLQRAKAFFVKPKNLFLSVYPPVANADPIVTKKTCLLARSLSEEETKLLKKSCKENKCTVHGAITASTYLATARILHREKHDLKFPLALESSYSASVRNHCEPKLSRDDFGAYVSASSIKLPVPLVQPDDKQGFWEFARACTREVHAQIDSKKYLNLLKFYHCIDIPKYCAMSNYEHNQGRRSHIFNINNYGAQQTNQSDAGPFKFAGLFFGVQGANIGPTFGNNIITVDGRLYWTVEYFPHVTSKTQTEDFFELSLQTLRQVYT